MKSKFLLGQLVCTRGVADRIKEDREFAQFVNRSLGRYTNADWGEMDASDLKQNDDALKNGDNRLFAAYKNNEHPDWKIWIITEWDHSATTVLFPDEY